MFGGGKRAVGQRKLDVMLLVSFLNLALQSPDLCLSASPGWEMTSPYSLLKKKRKEKKLCVLK